MSGPTWKDGLIFVNSALLPFRWVDNHEGAVDETGGKSGVILLSAVAVEAQHSMDNPDISRRSFLHGTS